MFSKSPLIPSSTTYSFSSQERVYENFRPTWPIRFAEAALNKAGIPIDHATPTVICIGSGAGADVEPFLKLGCVVYGVEPNPTLRQLAENRFSTTYAGKFFSINGTAHSLNLPSTVKRADLIVCAQSLHTFSSKVNSLKRSEVKALLNLRSLVHDDSKDRFSIWYYNLDPQDPKVASLHQLLLASSASYTASLTPLLDAALFEPTEFQHYIFDSEMSISTAQPVDEKLFDFDSLSKWLSSYSFFPKHNTDEIQTVLSALTTWFDANKNENNRVKLTFIGFIAQGPLRSHPYLTQSKNTVSLSSPISSKATRGNELTSAFWASLPANKILAKL